MQGKFEVQWRRHTTHPSDLEEGATLIIAELITEATDTWRRFLTEAYRSLESETLGEWITMPSPLACKHAPGQASREPRQADAIP